MFTPIVLRACVDRPRCPETSVRRGLRAATLLSLLLLPPLHGAIVDGFGHAGYAWGFGVHAALAALCVALIQWRFSPGVGDGLGAVALELDAS